MEEYIFIILAIILSIVGAVNRNKKKQTGAGQVANSGQQNPSGIFESLFHDDFMEEQESLEPEPVKATPPPIKKEKAKEKFLDHRAKIERIPPKSADLKKVSSIQKVTKNSKKSRIKELDGFSLKKAVIYSEIMNRRY